MRLRRRAGAGEAIRTRGGMLILLSGLGGCRGLDEQFKFSEHQFDPAGAVLLVIPGMLA